MDRVINWMITPNRRYAVAVKRRKFHNKQYGGGIVFQSYNIADLERRINELISQK